MIKLSLFFSLLATVNNFTSTSVAPPTAGLTATPAVYADVKMTDEELQFVELVNEERASRGLSRLTIDPLLVKIGRKHSQEMSDKSYFSHTSPTPGLKTPLDRYLADEPKRPSWALVGENLYYCSIVDVKRGHVALMNSPGHRANILESRYERIGVGAYTNRKGEFYITQMFLTKTD